MFIVFSYLFGFCAWILNTAVIFCLRICQPCFLPRIYNHHRSRSGDRSRLTCVKGAELSLRTGVEPPIKRNYSTLCPGWYSYYKLGLSSPIKIIFCQKIYCLERSQMNHRRARLEHVIGLRTGTSYREHVIREDFEGGIWSYVQSPDQ